MKQKTILIIVAVILLIGVTTALFFYNSYQHRIIPIDCNKPFDVIYLKPSEISMASEIANHINGLVVIPEENQIIARSELLLCENFNALDYLDFEIQ